MMDVAGMLDRLGEMVALREALVQEKQDLMEKTLPPEVRARLDDIEAEFAEKDKAAAAKIESLEESIKAAILAQGESVRGSAFQAVWMKGRQTWDAKGLSAYAESHPEVLQFRREGEPSVTIRKVSAKGA